MLRVHLEFLLVVHQRVASPHVESLLALLVHIEVDIVLYHIDFKSSVEGPLTFKFA